MISLQPQGRLDTQGGMLFTQQVASLNCQSQDLWVIDLAQVDFVDSRGLVALVAGLKAAQQSGCRMVLCNLQSPVQIVLELTQLDAVFEIFASYDAVITTAEVALAA